MADALHDHISFLAVRYAEEWSTEGYSDTTPQVFIADLLALVQAEREACREIALFVAAEADNLAEVGMRYETGYETAAERIAEKIRLRGT